MIDLNVVKAALENNSNKTAIKESNIRRIIVANLISRGKIYLPEYKINDLFTQVDRSNLSEEQINELAKLIIAKAEESCQDLYKAISEIFGESKKQTSVETKEAAQDDAKDEKKTPAEFVDETPTTKIEFSED